MAKPITQITEPEETTLRELYSVANKYNRNKDYEAIRKYMLELGLKYGFDPKKVSIDTRGRVFILPDETVYVVYNKVTAEIHKVFYDKSNAVDYMLNGSKLMHDLTWDEVEIA